MSQGVRIDLLLLECVGQVVRTCVEPRCKDLPLWDGGLRDVAAAKLKEMGVTDQPLTVVDLARIAGILGPDPNEVVVVNPSRRRAVPRV
jgi:hypothetical protein